jgi:hypothetical protein
MKARGLLAFAAAALLAVCLIILLRRDSGSDTSQVPTGASLRFLGFTNLAAQGDVAVFLVTNTGPECVSFDPDAFEYSESGVWITNSLRNQYRDGWLYWYHDTNGSVVLGTWYDFGGILEPGTSARIGAPLLATNTPWRLHFYCVEEADGVQGVVDRGHALAMHTASVVTNGMARNQRIFSGKRYYLISPNLRP